MYKINKPTYTAEDAYVTCIDMIKNAALREKLYANKFLIISAEKEFIDKVSTGKMYTIKREDTINGNITKKELEEVYTYRMARKNSTGRSIYDKILLSAKLGICPFCAHRDASTIDHYLPKTQYPRLSIVPINLIPCCKDCNDNKDSFFPVKPNDEFIHPYFDDIENDPWLDAKIIKSAPCSFKYYVNPPKHWTPLLKKRVKFHFEKLQLAKLYSTQAAVELTIIRNQLEKLFVKGKDTVLKFLTESSDTRSKASVNSWQAVFYRSASQTKWFYQGGFK